MRQIPYQQLIPGTEYYIWYQGLPANYSGKKIGTFKQFIDYEGVPLAQFEKLRDLPNAQMPSGLGTVTTNDWSVLSTLFYLPEVNELLTKQVLNQKLNFGKEWDKDNNFNINKGGKKKKTKQKKYKKKSKNIKTMNNKTRKPHRIYQIK